MIPLPRSRTRRALVAAAAALGALAAVAGSPYASGRATVDAALLARAVVREEDHVTAVALARWIRDRRPGLRVVDVRPAAEYAAFHVPTAECIPLDTLVTTRFDRGETIVLYSEGGAHAAQAWVLLRALGHERVYFLRGGLYEWLDDVMNPTLPAGASPERRARFEAAAELSRYFGGQPRADVADDGGGASGTRPRGDDDHAHDGAVPRQPAERGAALLARTRRRGC